MSNKISPTLKVLHEMRDRLDRVEATNKTMAEQLQRGMNAMSNELHAVAGAVIDVRDLLKDRLDQREAIADHERRLRKLERRSA